MSVTMEAIIIYGKLIDRPRIEKKCCRENTRKNYCPKCGNKIEEPEDLYSIYEEYNIISVYQRIGFDKAIVGYVINIVGEETRVEKLEQIHEDDKLTTDRILGEGCELFVYLNINC